MSMKNSYNAIGNRNHNVRLVAQYLNQLRHRNTSSSGREWQGGDADYSPAPIVKVKNKGRYTTTFHYAIMASTVTDLPMRLLLA
jgi:hypothetical protein